MVLLKSTDTCLDQQRPTRGSGQTLACAPAAEPRRWVYTKPAPAHNDAKFDEFEGLSDARTKWEAFFNIG